MYKIDFFCRGIYLLQQDTGRATKRNDYGRKLNYISGKI